MEIHFEFKCTFVLNSPSSRISLTIKLKINMTPRYLTKSRFKLGMECPTKLFYTGKPHIYPDKKIEDPFLLELAKGGFQVGELAKCYFPGGVEVVAERGEYDKAVEETNKLLESENVVIFEAAIKFERYFIRVDVLRKTGNMLEVIEVKSKSIDPNDPGFFGKRDGISSTWKSYLYDVAFQKYVTKGAFPQLTVSAHLMLTNTRSVCPTDGLNQKFRVKSHENGQKYCEVRGELSEAEIDPKNWVLYIADVDEECERIFDGTDTKNPTEGLSFYAEKFAIAYEQDERMTTPIASGCKSCEFKASAEEEAKGMRSGFKECWSRELGWADSDFDEPNLLEIWNFRSKDKFINDGKIKMSQIQEEDLKIKDDGKPGLSSSARQWLQINKAQAADDTVFIDVENLRNEMNSWKFPLHFIDFETATPAIPFTKGRRPYGEVAYQFSHHIVDADGMVTHVGEYLDERVAVFPNYEFVRQLRNELNKDEGTIFRYAAHENTYLVKIFEQLMSDREPPVDRDELCDFIRSITVSSGKSTDDVWKGERAMVDMLDLVKRYFYDPKTKGSNSIKQVLPAMLARSTYLQEKYSQPKYGNDIPSLNFKDWQWVRFNGDEVADPYTLLPKMFGDEVIDRVLDDDSDFLKDGGAAMMAYARLQFEDMSQAERAAIQTALKRYCELDTLAMVMIYEGWREMLK